MRTSTKKHFVIYDHDNFTLINLMFQSYFNLLYAILNKTNVILACIISNILEQIAPNSTIENLASLVLKQI